MRLPSRGSAVSLVSSLAVTNGRMHRLKKGFTMAQDRPWLGGRFGVAERWVELAGSFVQIREPFGSLALPIVIVPTVVLSGKHRLSPFQPSLTDNLGYVVVSNHVPVLAIDQIFLLFDWRCEIDG